jgi:hypothetical protein
MGRVRHRRDDTRVSTLSAAERNRAAEDWPDLPYQAWVDTRDTLHMCLQVIGKVRLALTPLEPQWANVPLYLTARGLTTSPMMGGRGPFNIDVDLVDHQVLIADTEGRIERIPLASRSVADFYRELMERLRSIGVNVHIFTTPSEVPDPIPFPRDTVHAAYDPEWVSRFWHVLSRIDLVFKDHRAHFRGKASPVQFFWGGFDLAYTRFSGRAAEPPPNADRILRLSEDAEQVSAGFWPGNTDFPDAAFYAYTYPKPAGIENAPAQPTGAAWNPKIGEFVLTYADAQRTGDVRGAILDFLDSTYRAGATRLNWDPDLTGTDNS